MLSYNVMVAPHAFTALVTKEVTSIFEWMPAIICRIVEFEIFSIYAKKKVWLLDCWVSLAWSWSGFISFCCFGYIHSVINFKYFHHHLMLEVGINLLESFNVVFLLHLYLLGLTYTSVLQWGSLYTPFSLLLVECCYLLLGAGLLFSGHGHGALWFVLDQLYS